MSLNDPSDSNALMVQKLVSLINMKFKSLSAVIFIFTFASNISAEDTESEDYAKSARRCLSAFECAVLAEVSGDTKSQEELFIYGYEEGKRFLEAARANKIKDEDLKHHVPMIVLMSLGGPSNDFVLGGLWSQAGDKVHDSLKDEEGNYPLHDELKKMRAEKLFRDKNCEIITRYNRKN